MGAGDSLGTAHSGVSDETRGGRELTARLTELLLRTRFDTPGGRELTAALTVLVLISPGAARR